MSMIEQNSVPGASESSMNIASTSLHAMEDAIIVSLDMIEEFLNYLRTMDRRDATIKKYASELKSFYNFLPEDKVLTSASLPAWRDKMVSENFATRTVNTRLAACNSFLNYLGRKSWVVSPISLEEEGTVPAITREEYHKLLKAARQLDKEWLYYLVKTFCCLGLAVSELSFFTVDAIVAGRIPIETKSKRKNVYIPDVLRAEFLTYAQRTNINSGLFFKSPIGETLNRPFIVNELRSLGQAAGIPESHMTPRSLRELYFNTYSDIRSASSALIDKEYSKILEQEADFANWESLAV